MVPLLGLLAALATAPSPDVPTAHAQAHGIEIAVRAQSIEVLPFLVARAIGAEDQAGIRFSFLDAKDDNPVASLRGPTDIAVGNGVDRALVNAEIDDLFTFYRRPPVALVAQPQVAAVGLTRLVMYSQSKTSLAYRLAKDRLSFDGTLSTVTGSSWFSPLSSFSVGQVDAVLGLAPLPQYLAARGGTLVWDASSDPNVRDMDGGSLYAKRQVDADTRAKLTQALAAGVQALQTRSAEELVEALTPQYPYWETDALYQAVQVAQQSVNPDGASHPEWRDEATRLAAMADPQTEGATARPSFPVDFRPGRQLTPTGGSQ
jgi:hypothetical protein